jgi:hypothetical protein
VTIAAALQQTRGQEIPFLSSSSAPDGLLALKLWLNELGYQTSQESAAYYQPPAGAALILLLEPTSSITDGEWKTLDRWVETGGTLILAGNTLPAYYALDHYDFSVSLAEKKPAGSSAWAPLLTSPPLPQPLAQTPDYYLRSDRSDFAVLLAMEDRPWLVSLEQGAGRVILSSTALPFTNLGLKDRDNAILALNLVALSARQGAVWFDDWHHGVRGAQIVGPGQWLRHTPAGHALVFVTLVIFLSLVLQGRSFGRPVPLRHELKRRGPLEHATAIANLNRKAGHRSDVMDQYRQLVKRRLGWRYRLNPFLPDDEYVAALAGYNPALDRDALLRLLKNLSQKNVGEAEMVKLAEEASRWISEQ